MASQASQRLDRSASQGPHGSWFAPEVGKCLRSSQTGSRRLGIDFQSQVGLHWPYSTKQSVSPGDVFFSIWTLVSCRDWLDLAHEQKGWTDLHSAVVASLARITSGRFNFAASTLNAIVALDGSSRLNRLPRLAWLPAEISLLVET